MCQDPKHFFLIQIMAKIRLHYLFLLQLITFISPFHVLLNSVFYHIKISCKNAKDYVRQGRGIRVKVRVGVSQSQPFWLDSESELESVKVCWLWLQPRVAGYQQWTVDDFAWKAIHSPPPPKKKEKRKAGRKGAKQFINKVEPSFGDKIPSDHA